MDKKKKMIIGGVILVAIVACIYGLRSSWQVKVWEMLREKQQLQ